MTCDGFSLEWAALSDMGRRRDNNEDAVLVVPDHGFAVLADGMGGYNAGEVASRMAVEGISAGLIRWLRNTPDIPEALDTAVLSAARQALEDCVDETNRAIFEDACTQSAHAGMGTTLVVTLVYGDHLLIGHVGDSRTYRWREGSLEQLTRDHSLLQEHIDAGLITPAQAAVSHYRNLLVRGVGVEKTTQLDTKTTPLQKGDIYLLCSDGLTDMASDAEIAAALGSGLPLPEIAQVLIDQASTNGGRDNITVALMRVIG